MSEGMEPVTAEQVERAVAEHKIRRWMLRRCGICGAGLFYYFEDDAVLFDSNCDCTTFTSGLRLTSYQDVAGSINMQAPEMRLGMWNSLLGLGPSHED